MTQFTRAITTAPELVIPKTPGYVTDWIIQNKGASELYLSESSTTGATGISLVSGQSLSKDDWKGEVWLVSASASDVRIWYDTWKVGEKYHVV